MPAIRARSARWVASFKAGDKAALRAAIAGMARSHKSMARSHKSMARSDKSMARSHSV
jgi:hypothetical protein